MQQKLLALISDYVPVVRVDAGKGRLGPPEPSLSALGALSNLNYLRCDHL